MVTLTERNPLVYQRVQDVAEGIYWINTQSPLAKAILNKYADHSTRWRDYLFQRYVDIFVKQILHELQKRDPEGFKADAVDNALDTKIMQIHSAALNDLGKFFFDETFVPLNPEERQ
jgi:adenylylsulfate kinase-like enzyme